MLTSTKSSYAGLGLSTLASRLSVRHDILPQLAYKSWNMKRSTFVLMILFLLVGTCSAPRVSAVTSAPPPAVTTTDVVPPEGHDRWRLPEVDFASAREHRLYKRAQRKLARLRKRLERRDGRLTTGGVLMIIGGFLVVLGLALLLWYNQSIREDDTGCAAVILWPLIVGAGVLGGAGLITFIVGLILHISARAAGASRRPPPPPPRDIEREPRVG